MRERDKYLDISIYGEYEPKLKKRADEREAIGKVDNTDQEEKPLSAERHSGLFIWNGYR